MPAIFYRVPNLRIPTGIAMIVLDASAIVDLVVEPRAATGAIRSASEPTRTSTSRTWSTRR
jgi:hypothetical protein